MGRRGKYPSPDTARDNFRQGVELAPEKWRSRTLAGEDRWDTWYRNYFVPRVYPQIPAILALVDPYARSRRVGSLVKRAAADYRSWKLRQIVTAVAPVPPPATPAPA